MEHPHVRVEFCFVRGHSLLKSVESRIDLGEPRINLDESRINLLESRITLLESRIELVESRVGLSPKFRQLVR